MSWRLPKRPGFNERIVENPSERRCSLLYSSKAATEAQRQETSRQPRQAPGECSLAQGSPATADTWELRAGNSSRNQRLRRAPSQDRRAATPGGHPTNPEFRAATPGRRGRLSLVGLWRITPWRQNCAEKLQ